MTQTLKRLRNDQRMRKIKKLNRKITSRVKNLFQKSKTKLF